MPSSLHDPVAAVRRFNRFYTRQIGLLDEGLLQSPFSLTVVRVLYEIAHRPGITATELLEILALDPGYLSRMLRGLRKQGLVSARAPASDRRRRRLSLTARGSRTFGALDARSSEEVGAMLARLSRRERRELIDAMRAIERLLGNPADSEGTSAVVELREPRPGDLGWVVKRHGELYAAEYDWNADFEGLVAGIVGRYVAERDPRVERCWIAELDGEPAGSVFLVRDTATVAKLRLLLVEPWARGHGVGTRLVEECLRFARSAGYAKVRLWTNDVLHAARRIYERAGFRLTEENRHHSFGHDLVGQTWELDLR
ncbi:MAG TPA: helix-turn-helix domain-containing GNAT family N-acetyltransferase [Gemmatimonadales bacterium]|nr:helix-turn-helix domain-containing GNAT family N-acetyltransferase [Gemmatimonadales bacterium]